MIHVARVGPKYNANMLISTILFWEGSTNTFYLRDKMVTHTLLDVVVIIGIRTTRETFDPSLKDKTKTNFSFTRPSYSNYIEDQYEDHHEKVSDYEHIIFLTFWLSHLFFCSSSLHVAKKFITLATQIHEG